jgi:LPS-assembly protein
LVLAAACALADGAAMAQVPLPSTDFATDPATTPALITADELTYDEDLGVVTASGSVEIQQGARILLADTVSYNLNDEIVVASGNVSLLNENGDVYFTEYAQLTGDLQEGYIRGIRALLADGVSRVAAARGIRTGANRTVFERTAFTPCEICRENPDAPPLWQLSARRIVHDQEDKEIRYRDATLDLFGIPVFYTPYFSHPDPTVNRKSGFLTPFYGQSDFLGSQFSAPYFWVIDDNVDLTVTPTYTTAQNPFVNVEYNHLLPNGSISISGSGTVADREDTGGTVRKDVVRGHIDAQARFDLSKRWRTGARIFRLTDDTYDQLYSIPLGAPRARVESNVYLEGFGGRNYAAVNAFAYQSLRSEEDDRLQPYILPEIDFNYVSEPLFADSFATADVGLLYLTREQGREVARASLTTGWTLPYTSDWGDVWTLRGELQTDAYWTEGHDPDNPTSIDNGMTGQSGTAGRVFPRASLEWRYPWSIQAGGWETIAEPIAQFVAAPNGRWFNRDAIPNEDSRELEFDDTSLFALDRFPGTDRVDPGMRVDYGFEYAIHSPNGLYSQLFLGQSYRLSENEVFTERSGLSEAGFSSFVGRAVVQPIPEVSLRYRFRYDNETFDQELHDVGLGFGVPALSVSVGYAFVAEEEEPGGFPERESVSLTLHSRLSENWSAGFDISRDLATDFTQQASVRLTYADECFFLAVVGSRNNFRDRDLEPDDRIFITFGLAQLGTFETDFAVQQNPQTTGN